MVIIERKPRLLVWSVWLVISSFRAFATLKVGGEDACGNAERDSRSHKESEYSPEKDLAPVARLLTRRTPCEWVPVVGGLPGEPSSIPAGSVADLLWLVVMRPARKKRNVGAVQLISVLSFVVCLDAITHIGLDRQWFGGNRGVPLIRWPLIRSRCHAYAKFFSKMRYDMRVDNLQHKRSLSNTIQEGRYNSYDFVQGRHSRPGPMSRFPFR